MFSNRLIETKNNDSEFIQASPLIKRGRPRKISKDPIVTSIDIENGEKGMPMNIKVTQVGDEVIIDADDDQGSMRQQDCKYLI